MNEQYSIKDFITQPIVMKVTEKEAALRNGLIEAIVSRKSIDEIDESLLKSLKMKNVIALDPHNHITAVYPVSVQPTNKKVIFDDGREAWAMCAIDAIGFHYHFNQPISIECECEHCGHKILLYVNNGKIDVLKGGDDIYVLHTNLSKYSDWSCSCCNIMHFFSGKHELSEWLKKNSHITQEKYAVTLETANKIAWLLFSQ